MIKLINGRGQLGTELKKNIEENHLDGDCYIYHTWNFLDKSKEVQEWCYNQFTNFVDSNPNSKIIFTSTYAKQENWYTHFKQLSEAYLITKTSQGYAIRLPNIIGKGICQKFKNDQAEPYGEIELITLEDAATETLKLVSYNGLVRNLRISGHKISSNIVKKLILFGKKPDQL